MPLLPRSSGSSLVKFALGAGLLVGARYLLTYSRRYDLRGKTAVVTGGARGLGLEIARLLVERGARVAVVARDSLEIERALSDLRGRSRHAVAIGVACDLTAEGQPEAMLEAVREQFGAIDVLVNDAGRIEVGPLPAMTLADFEGAMAVHWRVPLRTMLAVQGEMKARGSGRIANIASVGGIVSVPHLLPYSASKFALMGLSQGMHAELRQHGVIVSTIAPGLMRTGSPGGASFKGDHQKEYAWFAIADSLPLLSMSSARAARRVVLAIERGDSYVLLGLPAKLAAIGQGLMPGLVNRALSVVNTLLPAGTDPRAKLGRDSQSALAPSLLTLASDSAAARNNER